LVVKIESIEIIRMNNQILYITVDANKADERIDKFLAGQLPSVTRSRLKKIIDDDRVTISGKAVKANHLVKTGEEIRIHFPEPPKQTLEPEDIALDIVYEDQHLLVVNKPAGMIVHPAFGNYSGTLVNALLAHCERLSSVSGDVRPGLVHRLDKDTTGLLVVAKDNVTHVGLARQLSKRKMERQYCAIVWGNPKTDKGTVEAPLARHHKERTRMAIHQEGKRAVTHYTVLKRFVLTSFIQLQLETGRTHQIRVHMNSIGHPVFGDSTYGGKGKQVSGLNHDRTIFFVRLFKTFKRQMLHARTLAFEHPITKQWVSFESDIPDDMQALLAELEKSPV
jgi:23S rRNA pseudouridine1911/1915/1917 synthase